MIIWVGFEPKDIFEERINIINGIIIIIIIIELLFKANIGQSHFGCWSVIHGSWSKTKYHQRRSRTPPNYWYYYNIITIVDLLIMIINYYDYLLTMMILPTINNITWVLKPSRSYKSNTNTKVELLTYHLEERLGFTSPMHIIFSN